MGRLRGYVEYVINMDAIAAYYDSRDGTEATLGPIGPKEGPTVALEVLWHLLGSGIRWYRCLCVN